MLVVAAVLAALPVQREYLGDVVSPVVEAPGTAAEIAARGRICIGQILGSGVVGGELILSDDGTTIVARSAAQYSERLVPWQIRSRLTFEARDGRFRILQTSVERFNEYAGGWAPIGKWRGSGWERAEREFQAIATRVADCATTAAAADW